MTRDRQLRLFLKSIDIEMESINILNYSLTHSSYANDDININYEKYEFLGDAILEFIITEELFNRFNDKAEGELSKLRSIIVCESTLYNLAKKWNLGDYIRFGKGEILTGGKEKISILADCVEAVIAAVYLECGIDVAKKFVLRSFKAIIDDIAENKVNLDYKTKLQEDMHAKGVTSIEYRLLDKIGPEHKAVFYTVLVIDGKEWAKGIGNSKKESEQEAAKNTLTLMNIL